MVLLSVVDSAASLKAGQAPQTIGIQRFASCPSVRRTAFHLATGAEAQPIVVGEQARRQSPFAPIPRVEIDALDSGLCSPYSDPGDVVEQGTCSDFVGKGSGDEPGNPNGAISIDSLHNLLLERLFGGKASMSSGSATDDSAISNLAPSLTAMTPSYDTSPLQSCTSGRPNGSSMSNSSQVPAAALSAMQSAEEKFRCLAKHSTSTLTLGAPAPFVTKCEGVKRERQEEEHGKRVRSPNADDVGQSQNRFGKRMRHNLTGRGQSLHSTTPSVHRKSSNLDPPIQLPRSSRSSVPRKPAVPCFSGRSSSAPKARPNSTQDISFSAVPQTQKNARKSSAAVKTCVTVQAPHGEKLRRSTGSAFGKEMSLGQHKDAPRMSLQPAQRKAVGRTRPSGVAGRCETGNKGRKTEDGIAPSGLDESLIVYADVGRAVTSLVQQMSIVPDPDFGSIPDKKAIMEALGKLAAEANHNFGDTRDTTARAVGAHRHHQSIQSGANKENRGNALERHSTGVSRGREDCGAGIAGPARPRDAECKPEGRECKQDSPLTYVSVLKSRFGL